MTEGSGVAVGSGVAEGSGVEVGSGVTEANVDRYLSHAHGLIVGSHFKADGRWDRPVDADRLRRFMDRVRALRERGR